MRPFVSEPEFDIVIIGSGVAGALAAYRLAMAQKKVLILEAGGVAPESLGRWTMVENFIASSSKTTESPFCGEDVLTVDKTKDTTLKPRPYRFAEPDTANLGVNYYSYPDPPNRTPNPTNRFKSYYVRL